MTKRENILPFTPLGNLISQSTGKRVSKDAKETSAKILDEITAKIMHKAILLADNSGRKTIKAKDINLAFQQIKGDL